MSVETLFDNFDLLINSSSKITQLNRFILDLAVKGRLVPQDTNDEPASELLEKIKAEKEKLIEEGKIRKEKPFPPIKENEVPYELPNGWKWVRLGEATLITLGQSPSSTTYNFVREGLPFYQGKSDFGSIYPTPTQWCSSPQKIAEKEDILISVRAPVGPTNICNEKSCIGRGLASIRMLNGMPNFYIMYVLRAFEASISGKGSGTTFSAITGSDLSGILIPIPPFNEQKRIVSKIESIFDKSQQLELKLNQVEQDIVNLNKSAVNYLIKAKDHHEQRESWKFIFDNFDLLYSDERNIETLRQTILQEAVQGKLVPQDPDDESASELLEKIKAEKEKLFQGKNKEKALPPIKEDEIPYELPKGWEWVRLGEIVTIKGGKRVPAGYKLLELPTEYAYIRVTDMKNGTIDDSELRYISKEIYEKIKSYFIEKDDLYLVIVGATIGKVGIVPERFHRVSLTENAVRIIPYKNDPKFLKYLLSSVFIQDQFIDKTRQMAQPKLAIIRIKNTIIPLPPLNEQKRIVEKVNELMKLCDELESQLTQSKHESEKLMQAVLQEAFQGAM